MATILVIEDDPNMLEMIVEELEDLGHSAHAANDGQTAIDIGNKFGLDLIISDVRMPGQVDGIAALAAIKKKQPNVLCIVMTGYADEEVPMRALTVRVNDYLYKPFGLAEVCHAVQSCLEKNRDRSTYERLLGKLWSQPKKLLETLERHRKDSAGKRIEEARDLSYQSYFTLLRAKRLNRSQALALWDHLEAVEARYLEYRKEPDRFQPEQLQAGADYYDRCTETMTKWAYQHTVPPHKPREPGQASLQQFQAFFERVEEGKITVEQMKLASAIRNTAPEERDETVAKLYRHLWERQDDRSGERQALMSQITSWLEKAAT